MKVLYISPYMDFSGYAQASRDYIQALSRQDDMDVVVRPLKYDSGSFYYGDEIARCECKGLNNIDVVIQHTTPNEMSICEGVKNVGYFAWETTIVPSQWIEQLNKLDLVLVPCQENVDAYKRAGGTARIEKLVHTFDLDKYDKEIEPFNLPQAEDKFKLYCIAQLSKKKGVESMVRAYYRAFEGRDDVVFIMKLYQDARNPNAQQDREQVQQYLAYIKQMAKHNHYPPVLLIHQNMTDEEIGRLHKSGNIYVAGSRSEGFCIPAFDALGYGNPVIATNWGGMTEFVDSSNGWLVGYTLTPCFAMKNPTPNMYSGNEDWAEPNILDMASKMREAYEQHKLDKCKDKVHFAKEKVKSFSYDKIGGRLADLLRSI